MLRTLFRRLRSTKSQSRPLHWPRLERLEDRTLLAAGALDFTFGGTGKLTTPIGNLSESANSVAVQPDGKIVVAGYTFIGSNQVFALVRYNADGTLDTSFDGDGKVTTAIGAISDVANSVAVQADGKIVVAGISWNGINYDFALARYNSNGSLDASFDGGGKLITPMGSSNDEAYGVVVQADGKIIVAGTSHSGVNYDFALARYNADGSLDTSFSGDGRQTTDFGGSEDFAYSVALQADGRIVVAGNSLVFTGEFAVARYNLDGSLDSSFDGDGRMTTGVGALDAGARSLAVQADGKIVAAGYAHNGSNADFALARLNQDGSLDSSFHSDGLVTTDIGTIDDFATGVAVRGDGKIIVTGRTWNGVQNDFALAQYNANGTLDTSFHADGKLTTSINTSDDFALGIALQTDGKIVVAGSSFNGSNDDIALVRINPNGMPDTTFNGPGKVTSAFGVGDAFSSGMVLQPDGKIVVAGHSFNGSDNDFTVARYNPDGSVDFTFDGDGSVITPIGLSDDDVYDVALQPDGKIIVVGSTVIGFDVDIAVVRYNPDGSLDSSFDGDGIVTTDVAAFADIATSVTVQPDGRIVVAGVAFNGSDFDFAVVRYFPDGSLDGSFQGDGKVTTAIGTNHDVVNAVALQPDGKIVVAGEAQFGLGDFALARYNPDGSLDTLFDGDGIVTTPFSADGDGAYDLVLQADGKIVAAGYADTGIITDCAMTRYHSDGSLDSTFDGDGMLKTSVVPTNDFITSLTLQADGKFVAAGAANNGVLYDFAVLRFNPDGSPDVSFDGDGKLTTLFGPADDRAAGVVVVQPDGRIVAGGWSRVDIVTEFALVRFKGDNLAPNANPDTIFVSEDAASPVTFSVLTNDNEPNSDPVVVTVLSQPAHGTLAFLGGVFSYQPDPNYFGTDSFQYQLADDSGLFDVAQVQIVVQPVNDAPTAGGDVAGLPEDSLAMAIDVLANDSSAPDTGETLTITGVTQGANGSVVITGGGTGLTYQPNGNFNGTDSFTYTIGDGNGGTATATVVVGVTPLNDPPTANTDDVSVLQDSTANSVPVLANDFITPDSGESLTITAKTNGLNGTVTIINGGAGLIYTPTPGYSGPDSFAYTITDGTLGSDATATVNVTVVAAGGGGGNNPPDADTDGFTIPAGGASILNVLTNDDDPDFDTLLVTGVTQGANGTVSINAGFGSVSYTPTGSFVGNDSFSYIVMDSNGAIDTAVVNVTVVPAIGFKLATSSGSEAVKTVKLIVTLTPAQAATKTVDYAVTGGSADTPADFTLLGTGTLTFKPKKTSATIKLKINNDTEVDGNEDVILSLTNAGGLLIGPNPQHTYTILDNDTLAPMRSAIALDALFLSDWSWRKRKTVR